MYTVIQKVFIRNVSLRFYAKSKFCVCFGVHIPVIKTFFIQQHDFLCRGMVAHMLQKLLIHIHVIFFVFMLFIFIFMYVIFFIFMYIYIHIHVIFLYSCFFIFISCYIFHIHVIFSYSRLCYAWFCSFIFMVYFHCTRESGSITSHSCSAHQKAFHVLTIPGNAFWSGVLVWTSLAFISNFQMTSCPRSRALLAIILRYQINK